MRNCTIRECKNGYMVEMDTYEPHPINNCSYEQQDRGPYVFSDWSEMMEFIEDYFADEEE